jgi:hypothetical protein
MYDRFDSGRIESDRPLLFWPSTLVSYQFKPSVLVENRPLIFVWLDPYLRSPLDYSHSAGFTFFWSTSTFLLVQAQALLLGRLCPSILVG